LILKVLIAEVLGEVKLKVKVSGDPECVFGFNDQPRVVSETTICLWRVIGKTIYQLCASGYFYIPPSVCI
jgi:hypothetical protein